MEDEKPPVTVGLGRAEETSEPPSPRQQRVIDAIRSAWNSIATIPDKTVEDIDTLLASGNRREIVQSLRNKTPMSKLQRRALLSFIVWTLMLIWAFVTIALISFDPSSLDQFQAAYVLAAYSFATSLFLPTPYELLLGGAAESIGAWWAIGVSSFAKAVGTLVILSFGPSANAIVKSLVEKSDVATQVFRSLERLAGHPLSLLVVLGLFAIPFNSDTIILYLLAPLGVRRMWMVVVTFVAFAIRGTIVLALAGSLT